MIVKKSDRCTWPIKGDFCCRKAWHFYNILAYNVSLNGQTCSAHHTRTSRWINRVRQVGINVIVRGE